jgi:hypothetical protein
MNSPTQSAPRETATAQQTEKVNRLSPAQAYYLRKGKRTGSISTLDIKDNVAHALARRGLITLVGHPTLYVYYWIVTEAGREVLAGGGQ